jgi:hypothetical protein
MHVSPLAAPLCLKHHIMADMAHQLQPSLLLSPMPHGAPHKGSAASTGRTLCLIQGEIA